MVFQGSIPTTNLDRPIEFLSRRAGEVALSWVPWGCHSNLLLRTGRQVFDSELACCNFVSCVARREL